MTHHFFYVSKKKNELFYKILILSNVLSTIFLIFYVTHYTYKPSVKKNISLIKETYFPNSNLNFKSFTEFSSVFQNLIENPFSLKDQFFEPLDLTEMKISLNYFDFK